MYIEPKEVADSGICLQGIIGDVCGIVCHDIPSMAAAKIICRCVNNYEGLLNFSVGMMEQLGEALPTVKELNGASDLTAERKLESGKAISELEALLKMLPFIKESEQDALK